MIGSETSVNLATNTNTQRTVGTKTSVNGEAYANTQTKATDNYRKKKKRKKVKSLRQQIILQIPLDFVPYK